MSSSGKPDRNAILSAARRAVRDGDIRHTPFEALATLAAVDVQQLRREFSDWPQVALASFIDSLTSSSEQSAAPPLPDSPLERVLATAETLMQAAAAEQALLRIAIQGPAAAVWEELSSLFGPHGPYRHARADLQLAEAAGELPTRAAGTALRMIVGSVVGLMLDQIESGQQHGQQSSDFLQGTLLFGLAHLATLQKRR